MKWGDPWNVSPNVKSERHAVGLGEEGTLWIQLCDLDQVPTALPGKDEIQRPSMHQRSIRVVVVTKALTENYNMASILWHLQWQNMSPGLILNQLNTQAASHFPSSVSFPPSGYPFKLKQFRVQIFYNKWEFCPQLILKCIVEEAFISYEYSCMDLMDISNQFISRGLLQMMY